MKLFATIERTAAGILNNDPAPVVRYRLLRDVLRLPSDSLELRNAKSALELSRNVQELAAAQHADGGWGAFHSRSTRLKQKIPSTEVGVERALALGLDAAHPILDKASTYILEIMRGDLPFPDYQEKNDRWRTGKRLFLASTLSLIHPEHPELNSDRTLWQEITQRTFQSGRYREEDEIKAHADLTGATVKGSYLKLNGKYQLNILGSLHSTLPKEIKIALLRWLWKNPEGIGYLEIPLNCQPPRKAGAFDRWLSSIELLVRLFPQGTRFAHSSVVWLMKQRDEQGFWDFGARPTSITFLPLADSWRERKHRQFDWTTRILILLRRYCDGAR